MSAELELIKHVEALRAKDRDRDSKPVIGFDLFIALKRGFCDDFGGDALDARWNTTVTGTATAAALQTTSPSRVLMTTGVTSGSQSQLDENGVYKWSAADTFTLIVRAKISSLTNIIAQPARLTRVAGTDQVILGFISSISATNFSMRTVVAGVTTTTVLPDVADTGWHIYALSVKAGTTRGRIDGGAYSEIAAAPAVDMQLTPLFSNTAAEGKSMELDYVIMVPGYNLF